jgi:hypothetical protein
MLLTCLYIIYVAGRKQQAPMSFSLYMNALGDRVIIILQDLSSHLQGCMELASSCAFNGSVHHDRVTLLCVHVQKLEN